MKKEFDLSEKINIALSSGFELIFKNNNNKEYKLVVTDIDNATKTIVNIFEKFECKLDYTSDNKDTMITIHGVLDNYFEHHASKRLKGFKHEYI